MTDIAGLMATITAAGGRYIPVPGTLNFRDTGGYPAAGGVTRWRTLLRSDALHRLEPGGAAELSALELNTVLDLRTAIETEFAPSPLDDFAADSTASRHVSVLGEDLTELPGELREIYDFVIDHRGSQIGAAIRVLCRPGGLPALVHCTAGKDRTGIVVAFALAVAGVPDPVIAADYALSSAYLDARYTPVLGQLQAGFGMDEELSEALLASPPELIVRALDRARSLGGGSVEGYLNAHDVDGAELRALRDGLVGPSDSQSEPSG